MAEATKSTVFDKIVSPSAITWDVSKQVVEVGGMLRYVKHIRPRNGMQQNRMSDMADVEIEVIDGELGGCKNAEENSTINEDAGHLEANSEVGETELPRSHREQPLPVKYSESCCL